MEKNKKFVRTSCSFQHPIFEAIERKSLKLSKELGRNVSFSATIAYMAEKFLKKQDAILSEYLEARDNFINKATPQNKETEDDISK